MHNKYKIYVFASVCASLGLIRSTEATISGLDDHRKELNPQTHPLSTADVINSGRGFCSFEVSSSDRYGMSQCNACFNDCIIKMPGNLKCCALSCINAVDAYLTAVKKGNTPEKASDAFVSAGPTDSGCKNNSSTPSNAGLASPATALSSQPEPSTPKIVNDTKNNTCNVNNFGSDTTGMNQCGGCFNNCINKMPVGNLQCCASSCTNAASAYHKAVNEGNTHENASYAFGSAGVNDSGCKNNSSTASTVEQLYNKTQPMTSNK